MCRAPASLCVKEKFVREALLRRLHRPRGKIRRSLCHHRCTYPFLHSFHATSAPFFHLLPCHPKIRLSSRIAAVGPLGTIGTFGRTPKTSNQVRTHWAFAEGVIYPPHLRSGRKEQLAS